MSSESEPSEEHALVELQCHEEDCDELEVVTILEHSPDSKQYEFVKEALLKGARLHQDEIGHGYEVHEESGTPEEMEARYEELTGEPVIA